MHDVLDAGLGQLAHQRLPALRLDADRHVVQAAEHLGVGPDVEAGKVEERDQVPVADVEEEVRRPWVVAVLDQLGQREAEDVDIFLGDYDAQSLATVYGYKEGWGALGPELADDLLRLMAPGGMQSESKSIEQGEGEKDDPRGTDTGD